MLIYLDEGCMGILPIIFATLFAGLTLFRNELTIKMNEEHMRPPYAHLTFLIFLLCASGQVILTLCVSVSSSVKSR